MSDGLEQVRDSDEPDKRGRTMTDADAVPDYPEDYDGWAEWIGGSGPRLHHFLARMHNYHATPGRDFGCEKYKARFDLLLQAARGYLEDSVQSSGGRTEAAESLRLAVEAVGRGVAP